MMIETKSHWGIHIPAECLVRWIDHQTTPDAVQDLLVQIDEDMCTEVRQIFRHHTHTPSAPLSPSSTSETSRPGNLAKRNGLVWMTSVRRRIEKTNILFLIMKNLTAIKSLPSRNFRNWNYIFPPYSKVVNRMSSTGKSNISIDDNDIYPNINIAEAKSLENLSFRQTIAQSCKPGLSFRVRLSLPQSLERLSKDEQCQITVFVNMNFVQIWVISWWFGKTDKSRED